MILIRAIIAAGILSLVAASGCSGEVQQRSSGRILCNGWVARVDPPDGTYAVVLDVVAFPQYRLEMGQQGAAGSPADGLRFAKFGLLIRSGANVEITMKPDPKLRAVMEWSPEKQGEPAERVVYGDCGEQGRDWLSFPGGMWVSGPGCYEVVVHSGAREEAVWVRVDSACG